MLIIGLILLIPVLHRFNVYNMLVYGAMVSAMSLFVLAVPSYGQMTYVVSISALLVLTVGEVVWSPRLQEYTAAIAPAGQWLASHVVSAGRSATGRSNWVGAMRGWLG